MKKLISMIAVCLILLTSFTLSCVNAADDFEIENGVLLSYNGSAADVSLPSSVTAVGASAFAGNNTIVSVTIPSSVDSIGERAFYGCSSLKTVKGGSGVTEVGALAFNGTPYFSNSTDEFLMLGKTLLWYNGDLMYITLPSNCVSIAPYAFLRCATAKMIRSSSDIVSVGEGAFYECSQLTSVDLPDSVTYIGAYAFDGTPFISSMGDFPIIGDGILVRYMGTGTSVEIPDEVRRIASRAFRSSKLKSVVIPSSVFSIDSYAFADCAGLQSVGFSEGLVMIGDGAFRGCKSLKKLVTPGTLSYIGQYAFNVTALKNARILGSHLIISDNAFKNCYDMDFVLLSDGVGELRENAFAGCSGLSGISISSDTAQISASAFSGCDNVTVTCAQGSSADKALSSHEKNHVLGDADCDGELNILDATAIQCYTAELLKYNGAQAAASDYDFNGVIDVMDAAEVQLSLAELK